MAQSTLHFAAGMLVGTAATVPALIRACRGQQKLARPIALWTLVSYGLGLYATVPSVLRAMGATEQVWGAWWMNVFLFFPLLDRVQHGGILIGEGAIAAIFAAQYALIVLAAYRAGRARPSDAG